ncbi:RING finger protein B-like [Gastrophryne carolinensis]
MGRLEFYAVWSLLEAPRQLVSRGGRMTFQLPLPLPLPKQLVIFGLGDWSVYSSNTCVSAQLCAGSAQAQQIGSLSSACRSLVWDGNWNLDIVMDCVKMAARGVSAKLILTVTENEKKGSGFSSSTPAKRRLSVGLPTSPLLSESTIAPVRHLELNTEEKILRPVVSSPSACTMLKDSPPPKKAAIILPLADKEAVTGELPRRVTSKPRNPRRLCFSSRGSEDGPTGRTACPSARWCHSVCLCDPDTAILIGGEKANEQPCQDSLWKLEIESDFWFQMDSCPGTAPQCSRGHTATYDPESKKVYVYGGMRESRWHSNVYVLDTQEWKWTLLVVVGRVPTLGYHSATMYQRELYVFGGLCPQIGTEAGSCTNNLYIFNPEYRIWYQPIVEGERPSPRYGHSATLLGSRLVIFGGRRSPTPVYLNDLHILDLGYMEYSTVSFPASTERPSPRCFHAAMQLTDTKLLIHGGCSGSGALKDAFIFNLDGMSWSSITFGVNPQLPRAGHSLLNLTSGHLTDSDKEKRKGRRLCRVLIIGGSDGSGNFYSDTPKFQLDLSI